MSNLFFKLNVNDLMGAVVSSVIVALVGYLSTVSNITDIDLRQVLNIAFLTGIASLLKALGTDSEGRFGGIVKIK